MLFPKILIFFSQYINFIRTSFVQDQFQSKVIKIDRFDGKHCGTKVPMEFSYIGMKSGATSLLVANSTIIIKEDIMGKPKMTVTIRRCKTRENLDSCEDFQQMQNLDYCQTINPDILFGRAPVAIPYQPKYKCPVKKDTYRAYNFTLSLTPFIFFKLDDWYWRIRLNILWWYPAYYSNPLPSLSSPRLAQLFEKHYDLQ